MRPLQFAEGHRNGFNFPALHQEPDGPATGAGRVPVSQSTISRWEAGVQDAEPQQRARIEALLKARLDSAADHALARLVASSCHPVHLVCDLTHRLLACSAPRATEFSIPATELLGRSLWPFATEEIAAREAKLDSLGWREGIAAPALEFAIGANGSLLVPIRQSQCRWTRLTLSDGSTARMVETL